MENIFIARQPILNKSQFLYGYEILFRDSMHNYANIDDDSYAIGRTLINLFENFGVDNILGNFKGFLNVSDNILMQDVLDIIPKDKFIFEILESSKVNDEFIERVKYLKKEGYVFALDDFVFEEEHYDTFYPLIKYASFIKIDLRQMDNITLAKGMQELKGLPVKFLAEKVETRQEYLFCKDLGFDFYQGFYFAKPSVMQSKSVNPSKVVIIKLMDMINKGEAINKIIEVFNLHPELSYSLLKFINSAAFYFRTEIKSLSHAINLLGLKNLQNWLMLLNYAGNKSQGLVSPLFHTAVTRAKLLEILTGEKYDSKENKEAAFLVGLLSYIDVLYKRPMDELLRQLSIDKSIYDGLIFYKGFYGELLKVAVFEEQEEFGKMNENLVKLGFSNEDYSKAKLESISWLNNLVKSL